MLEMIKGCRVDDPSILFEGYERTDSGFAANVDADKLQRLFEGFIRLHNEDCFVILEVPTNASEEFQAEFDGTFHNDVFYLDGLTPERAIAFLNAYGQWLINDGISIFGIGIHSGGNEMLLDKYNVVTVYTKNEQKYHGFFEKYGINQVPQLMTAWDYFTEYTPGDSYAYTYKGMNIYGLVVHLKQYGLYFAVRREQ